MDQEIKNKYELTFLAKEETSAPILSLLGKYGAVVVAEKPLQKMRLAYDMNKHQFAFVGTIDLELSPEKEVALRHDLKMDPALVRAMLLIRKEKKQEGERRAEQKPKTSRLRSAIQAMLPNEALEKKIEEILQ